MDYILKNIDRFPDPIEDEEEIRTEILRFINLKTINKKYLKKDELIRIEKELEECYNKLRKHFTEKQIKGGEVLIKKGKAHIILED